MKPMICVLYCDADEGQIIYFKEYSHILENHLVSFWEWNQNKNMFNLQSGRRFYTEQH